MDIAIANLMSDAAAHPGLTGAIAGLTFLAVGVWWVLWSLVDRVAELEGRHNDLAQGVSVLEEAGISAIIDTRKKVAQLSRRVKRLRDEKGRFVKKPKLHEAA